MFSAESSEHPPKNNSRFREIVYALYTVDGIPREIPAISGIMDASNVSYVVAHMSEACLVEPKTGSSLADCADELRIWSDLAGYFKTEWFVPNEEGSTELVQFVQNEWPPHGLIAYLSQFCPHPLLTSDLKPKVLNSLMARAAVHARQYGYIGNAYGIMTARIAEFVVSAGVGCTLVEGARINHNHLGISQLRQDFPKYWSDSPGLYRFDLKGLLESK